jgi:hypothetical protein
MPSQLDVVSPDWTPVLGWGIAIIGLAAVAAVAGQVIKAALGNPIPYEVRKELEAKYGHWAVQTAIKVCPLDDIECIKRESRRLYESRILRR